jgi:RNA polymerase sigma factor (sigma-70 family)
MTDQTALDAYVARVRKLPRLSAAQTAELHNAWRGGDLSAKHILWQETLRLVLYVAKSLAGKGIPFTDDLLQEGNMAAGLGLDTWDPELGALSTWIVPKVRGAMMDYSMKDRMRGTGGKDGPTPIMSSLDASAGVIDDYAASDLPGEAEQDSATRHDSTELPAYESPETATYRAQVRQYVDRLPVGRVRGAVQLYFGLDGQGEFSAGEIATLYGISRSHVHRLITAGLDLIRRQHETRPR